MENVVIEGELKLNGRYAVLSTTTTSRNSLSFIFFLPLTVAVWMTRGFDSLVIVVGNKASWESNHLYMFVLISLKRFRPVLVFIDVESKQEVMVSQVVRLFVSNMLHVGSQMGEVYLLTTDCDLWPISSETYKLPGDKLMLSVHSECCGYFHHMGIKYRMLPMSNIGMSISTWRNVTRNIGNSSQPVKDMVDFLTEEFGNVTQQSIVKGKNDEWYMDQKIISILVQKWINSNVERRKKVLYLPRNTGQDRIDRNRWPCEVEISKKVDAHLPNNAFMTKKWRETKPLLKLLTLNDTELYAWCISYHKKFSETLVEVRNARSFIGRQLSSGHS